MEKNTLLPKKKYFIITYLPIFLNGIFKNDLDFGCFNVPNEDNIRTL